MVYIGIKDGKVFDITSRMENRRKCDDGIPLTKEELDSVIYLEGPYNKDDIMIEDSYINKEFLKDSPKRFEEPKKTDLELRLEVLENRIKLLEL